MGLPLGPLEAGVNTTYFNSLEVHWDRRRCWPAVRVSYLRADATPIKLCDIKSGAPSIVAMAFLPRVD